SPTATAPSGESSLSPRDSARPSPSSRSPPADEALVLAPALARHAADLEPTHDGQALAVLVGVVARVALLVATVGGLVDDLELRLHEDHAPEGPRGGRRFDEEGLRHPHRHVDDEVHDAIARRREAVVDVLLFLERAAELEHRHEGREVG